MADKITNWFPVDVSSNPKAAKAYEGLKEANAKAREAREAFEAVAKPLLAKHAPDGHEPVFSYRFGKLSCGFRPVQAKADKGGGAAADGLKL